MDLDLLRFLMRAQHPSPCPDCPAWPRFRWLRQALGLLTVLALLAGPAQAALVGAWAFNEGSGTTAEDLSGAGNAGTVHGATWTPSGRYGGALAFNGTSALVTVPHSASLAFTTAFTVMAWVYPNTGASGVWRDVIYKSPDDTLYLEGASGAGPPATGGTFTPSPLYGPATLPANTWSHLAATYDGATLRLYVNGSQVASRAQTGTLASGSGPLSFGGDAIYGQYWAGRIDEVRVYSHALTAAQITTDMTTPISAGTPPTWPAPAVTATFTREAALTLTWQDHADNEDGFTVERRVANEFPFVAVATVPADTTLWVDPTLTTNVNYCYRVNAYNVVGVSGYTNEACAVAH